MGETAHIRVTDGCHCGRPPGPLSGTCEELTKELSRVTAEARRARCALLILLVRTGNADLSEAQLEDGVRALLDLVNRLARARDWHPGDREGMVAYLQEAVCSPLEELREVLGLPYKAA